MDALVDGGTRIHVANDLVGQNSALLFFVCLFVTLLPPILLFSVSYHYLLHMYP